MNRFLNEDNGLQMAFLDGNQPDRLCAPMRVSVATGPSRLLPPPPASSLLPPSALWRNLLHINGHVTVYNGPLAQIHAVAVREGEGVAFPSGRSVQQPIL